jgi:hypothetical protein
MGATEVTVTDKPTKEGDRDIRSRRIEMQLKNRERL